MKNLSMIAGLTDIGRALVRQRLCYELALEDLRDRYRRTIFGLLWICLSFLLFVLVKNIVFSTLSDRDPAYFFTYMTVGFAIWTFMQSVLTEGSNCYNLSRFWILGTNLPYFLYICRYIYRAAIEFLLVMATALAACLLIGRIELAGLAWFVPVLAFYMLTAVGAIMLLAPLAVLFPDVVHAVRSVMRVMFFATPIIWVPVEGTVLETVALYNPFTHYIALLRGPLLGEPVAAASLAVCAAGTGFLLLAGLFAFSNSRRSIAYLI